MFFLEIQTAKKGIMTSPQVNEMGVSFAQNAIVLKFYVLRETKMKKTKKKIPALGKIFEFNEN